MKIDVITDDIVLTLLICLRVSAEEIVRRLQKHVGSEMCATRKLSPWERGYLAIVVHLGEETTGAVQSFISSRR